jgi:hypothetical protein
MYVQFIGNQVPDVSNARWTKILTPAPMQGENHASVYHAAIGARSNVRRTSPQEPD